MKKILEKLILAGLFMTCFSGAFAQVHDEFYLPDVDAQYIGTYIPTYFEAYMINKKVFYEALSLDSPDHDVLFLGKNICYSDAGFHDGYAVKAEEFKDYLFVSNSTDTYCIDTHGGSYHKISENLNSHGYGYSEYAEYVASTLLSFAKDMKNVEIHGTSLILDGVKYEIELDGNFFDTENVALWLILSGKGSFALMKNGVNGELHASHRGDYHMIYPDEEVLQEFPLMFLRTDKAFPRYWNLPKEQYRYLRNLVFARHGYIFKSEDLKTFFRQFSWYHTDPDFNENQLSKDEKEYIEWIQRREENN